jgi:hypothetical protein
MWPADNTTQVRMTSGAIVSFQAFALERTDIDRERMHHTRQGRDLLGERRELVIHALLRRRQRCHPLREYRELVIHALLRRRQRRHPLRQGCEL